MKVDINETTLFLAFMLEESETEKSQINCLGTERHQDSGCNHLSHYFRISHLSFLTPSAVNIYDSMYTLYTLLML